MNPHSNRFKFSALAVAGSAALVLSAQTAHAQEVKIHSVVHGEYLQLIADRYGVTVDNIKQWNNLSSNYLFTGNQLIVSQPQASTTEQASVQPSNQSTSTVTQSQPQLTGTGMTAAPQSSGYYTVKAGDSLWAIANKYGTSIQQLKQWNNLSSNFIYPGKQLAVQVSTPTKNNQVATDTKVNKPSVQPTQPTSAAKSYVVRPGDSLWAIATRHGVTIQQLKQWNNLRSNYIYAGNQLRVSPVISTPSPNNQANPTPSNPVVTKPSPSVTVNVYTVKPGDSLWAIATKYGTTIQNIKTWNNLKSNYIYAGNQLYVKQPNTNANPTPDKKPTVSQNSGNHQATNQATNQGPATYTVKAGDSLWAIATKHGITIPELKRLNNLRSNYIYPGNQLVVKSGKTTPNVSQPSQPASQTPQKPAAQISRSVFIDAGHGGAETGTDNFGVKEKDLNLKIARQVSDRLRAQGYSVFETRKNDRFVSLEARNALANDLKTDIFVSIHHNAMPANLAGSAKGIVTLYHDRSVDWPGFMTPENQTNEKLNENKRLAQSLQNALINETGAKNMGARPQNLHVTRTTDMPSALVELGFMDNYSEFKQVTNSVYQAKLVDGLVKGINHFFGR